MGSQLMQSVLPLYNWLAGIMVPWGLMVLFALSFLESLYIIGLFTPGEVTVVAAALVAAGSKTPLWAVLAVAVLGNISGVAFGYYVGHKFGLTRMRILMEKFAVTRIGRWTKTDPGLIDDIAEYFEKHGQMTAFGARFAYGAKSFIPPIAGATHMGFSSFILSSFLGGLIYNVGLVAVGWALRVNAPLAATIMKSIGWFAAMMVVILGVFGFAMIRRYAKARKMRFLEKHDIPHEIPQSVARRFWREIQFIEEVSSTNDYAYESAMRGQAPPAAYIAARQTAGRGRLGRTWESPRGNVYLSMLLEKTPPQQGDEGEIGSLSLLTAMAVGRAFRKIFFEKGKPELVDSLKIKWPNDIYIGKLKACGILLEARSGFIIVGVGVNNIRESAGSVAFLSDFGIDITNKQLAYDILDSFEDMYSGWLESGFIPYLEEYTNFEKNVSRYVEVFDTAGNLLDAGYCVGFTPSGHMILADGIESDSPSGHSNEREISSGDVTLKKGTAHE